MNEQTQNSIKIYNEAKAMLGKPLSGNNPTFGCALTVNAIVNDAIGEPVGGGASTYDMYRCLQDTCRFTKIVTGSQLPGDIIISPSGYSSKGVLHGHVGITGIYGILSNSSEDGLLHENYTVETWKAIFGEVLGFPVEFYRTI